MKRRGQGILDFVIMLAVIIAALVIMANYVRNSLSGRLRETGDVFGRGEVYKP